MSRISFFISALSAISLAAHSAQAQQWTTDVLSEARGKMASATVGDLVFFAGGDDPDDTVTPNSAVVDIYNMASGTWTLSALSMARAFLAGSSVGQLAIFAGGGIDSMTPLDVVDVYDAGSMSWYLGHPLSQARSGLVATTVGDKVIFAGGASVTGASNVVDIYDAGSGLPPSNPAAWTQTTLSQERTGLVAVTVGNLAMFAGGFDFTGTWHATVDIYDDSTGLWTVTALSLARSSIGAAAVGSCAYFGGGQTGPMTMTDRVDVYDALSGTWTMKTLPEPRTELMGAALGNTVIFGGGFNGAMMTPVVHMLNTGTDQWDSTRSLSQARWAMGVGTVGGKALFGGGRGIQAAPAFNNVDIYEPIGLNYCAATPNSTGGAATISASGSSSVLANNLTLTAQPVPDQPGVFFYGPAQIQQPFGNGIQCVGTAGAIGIARLPVVNAAAGVMTHTVDNTMPPTAATQILPGSTWHFQAWFRDPMALGAFFDLSDAMSIQFTP